eukprot:Skav221762  [mRNA]  locus=scaffold490:30437:35376:+ [translate_table: standard]
MPGRLFRFWFLVYTVISCGFRFGEATVPGPASEGSSNSSGWSLGVCNPSGLQGKAHVLASIASDVVAISETHLTGRARDAMSTMFRTRPVHYTHLVAGAPVAPRSDASDAGFYAGVAIAACHPSRALQLPWPPDLFESNRVQAASTWCHGMWISGAVVYGYPESKYHAHALSRTEAMLDFVFASMLSLQGPRYVAGDWNHTQDKLASTRVLREAGWVEIQDLREHLTGLPPEVTCKARTRKDFLWCSPELSRMFASLDVIHDVFADHSVLKARFHGGKLQEQEQQAQIALGAAWSSKMAGRAQQCTPRIVDGWAAPIKKGRSCDVQPNYLGFDRLHAKWFKQLRRIQNYVNWAKCTFVSGSTTSDVSHGILLWTSILRSSGFSPSFAEWWPQRASVCVGDPPVVPPFLPTVEQSSAIYHAFQFEVRLLEQRLQQARAATRQHAHEHDPYLVFKELRRPPALPVETLVQPESSRVHEVDLEETALVLDEPGRWCRHDAVPHSQWASIISFAHRHLPFREPGTFCITPDAFKAEVHGKKPFAATGLDGISRADLLHVGPNVVQSLLNMYHAAEAQGFWPQQILAGRVSSLAKTPDAQAVNELPICIFSLCYRVWSSLHARALLRDADNWVDASVFGNRKGKQAAHLWKMVVHHVEEAYSHGTTLSGLTADIVKAFKCLPRWPVLMLALQCGCPHGVLNGWAGALAGMIRHFRVRDSYSRGFATTTGLAEGCSLSCYGMLLLDHCFHVWVQVQNSQVRALSYVDNIELITTDQSAALRQLDLLMEFTQMVDLTLDTKKTFAWSVDAGVRKQLRQRGLTVKHMAKDLGAHLGFSRQFTNSYCKDRMQTLDTFWPRLKSCKCAYMTKVRALRTMAWPRGLHAISSAPIGSQQWLALRRQATQALGLRKPGINPAVALGLVEADADPQWFGLLATVRDARVFSDLQAWDDQVFPYAELCLDLPPNSPSRILVERLIQLGIRVEAHGLVRDPFGAFDLLRGNYLEVLLRLSWCWQAWVATQVDHREDFTGLANVNVCDTRRVLLKQHRADQPLLRHGLCGGFLTGDSAAHWDDSAGSCKWCGQPDSLKHRYWLCPGTSDLRTKCAPTMSTCWEQFPSVLTLRGWNLNPPMRSWFVSYLASVPSALPRPGCVLDWEFDYAGILGAGPLPGLQQHAYRAELYAMAVVLHFAALANAPVQVWSDCQGVVHRCNLLLLGNADFKVNSPHSDLWDWIQVSVAVLGASRCQIRKVPAHRVVRAATSVKEAWLWRNNNAADRVATSANRSRPSSFWASWEKLCMEYTGLAALHSEVVALHLAIADRSMQHDRQLQSNAIPFNFAGPRTIRMFQMQFDVSNWQADRFPVLARTYGTNVVHKLVTWWTHRQTAATSEEPRWIAVAHLYVDFQLATGHPGPLKSGKHWLDVDNRPHLNRDKFPFLKRLRWFRLLLKGFWKEGQAVVGMVTNRPVSDVIQTVIATASIPWSSWHLDRAEAWLATHVRQPCVRGTKALNSLPVALVDPTMAIDP